MVYLWLYVGICPLTNKISNICKQRFPDKNIKLKKYYFRRPINYSMFLTLESNQIVQLVGLVPVAEIAVSEMQLLAYKLLKIFSQKLKGSCWLLISHSARNLALGLIIDEHLTVFDQISSLSKSCYSHIRELRCIRPCTDSESASTIAASIVHSKLDYCNFTSIFISL